jgi:hypothetical protein
MSALTIADVFGPDEEDISELISERENRIARLKREMRDKLALGVLVHDVVAISVRYNHLRRRIRNIRGYGRAGAFETIYAGAVARILAGEYPDFPKAMAACLVDGEQRELRAIAILAADAERQQLLTDTAATSDKEGGDPTQLDKRDRHTGTNANATPLARLAIQKREEREEAAEARWKEAVEEFDGQVVDWSKTLEPLQRSMLQLMAGIYTYGNIQIQSTKLPKDAAIYTAICEGNEKLVANPAPKWVRKTKKKIAAIRAYLEGLANRILNASIDAIDALIEVGSPSAGESEVDPVGDESATAHGPNEDGKALQLPDGNKIEQAPTYGRSGNSKDSANSMRGFAPIDYSLSNRWAGCKFTGLTEPPPTWIGDDDSLRFLNESSLRRFERAPHTLLPLIPDRTLGELAWEAKELDETVARCITPLKPKRRRQCKARKPSPRAAILKGGCEDLFRNKAEDKKREAEQKRQEAHVLDRDALLLNLAARHGITPQELRRLEDMCKQQGVDVNTLMLELDAFKRTWVRG